MDNIVSGDNNGVVGVVCIGYRATALDFMVTGVWDSILVIMLL